MRQAKNSGRLSLPGAVRAGPAAGLGQDCVPREKKKGWLERLSASGWVVAAEAMHGDPPGHGAHTVLETC